MRDLSEYSQEGLRGLLDDLLEQVFAEEKRRVDETWEFLGRLCLLDRRCTLWYLLLRSGGSRRFNEIHAVARSIGLRSHDSVSKYLDSYIEYGLTVKHQSGRYQMIAPRWLEPD